MRRKWPTSVLVEVDRRTRHLGAKINGSKNIIMVSWISSTHLEEKNRYFMKRLTIFGNNYGKGIENWEQFILWRRAPFASQAEPSLYDYFKCNFCNTITTTLPIFRKFYSNVKKSSYSRYLPISLGTARNSISSALVTTLEVPEHHSKCCKEPGSLKNQKL